MKMKKTYETMTISVVTLSNEDVLTASVHGHAVDYHTMNLRDLGFYD
jgi:hypothetical protein